MRSFVLEDEEVEFWNLFQRNPVLVDILERSAELDIPNWCFGAGCIAQTIWNVKSGNPVNAFIKDVDWVYYDPVDLSEKSEKAVESLVSAHFRDVPLKFDVKNQARVHTWYEAKFGYSIAPYSSIYSAVETWPTTATAVAVTTSAGAKQVYAPYGLDDLLKFTVRPNKKQITESIYLSKVERWRRCWPLLRIVPWGE